MEKDNTQQDLPEEVVEEEQDSAVEDDKAQPGRHKLLWFAIVILLGLLAGLFWFMQQQQQLQQAETTVLAQRLDAAEQFSITKLAQLKQVTTGRANGAELQRDELHKISVGLATRLEEVAAMQKLTDDDVVRIWTLAEVEFLLQVANQRVLLAGDVESAHAALMLADQRINGFTDPRLFPLRSLIADEQLALASVAKIDVESLAIKLQSAINSVDSLQVLLAPTIDSEDEDQVSSEEWSGAMNTAWQEIKSLVVIRQQQDGTAAVLVPEQRYFLYQNLRLKLETARLALLSGEASTFDDSLKSASQWLQKYFIGEQRDAMLTLVAELQAQDIAVEIPDISASLIWLKGFER